MIPTWGGIIDVALKLALSLPVALVGAGVVVPLLIAKGKRYKVTRGMRQRRSSPIRCYVGPNGAGKTMTLMLDLLPDIYAGRKILSNTTIYDPKTGEIYAGWVKLTTWRQLLEARNCTVVLDEVTGIAEARSFATLPAQLLNMLMQLRKRRVTLLWTSPYFERADVGLRQITRWVVVCRSFIPKRLKDAETDTSWKEYRLFIARAFDAAAYDNFKKPDPGKKSPNQPKQVARPTVFWRPGHVVNRVYDTNETVHTLDHMDMFGTCITCNGKRAQPKCTCQADDSEAVDDEGPALTLVAGESEPLGRPEGSQGQDRGSSSTVGRERRQSPAAASRRRRREAQLEAVASGPDPYSDTWGKWALLLEEARTEALNQAQT